MMKPLIFGFALSTLLFNPYWAKSQVRFGPLLGINVSTLNQGSDNGDVVVTGISSAISSKFGALVDIPASERIGIQSGLVLSGYGADYKLYNTNFGNSETVETRLFYVGIPVDFYIRPLLEKPNYSISGGIEINGLAAATTNGESDGGSYSKVDLQAKFGIQTMLTNGLGAKLQYGIGTKNIFINEQNSKFNFDHKIRSFSVSIFYLFGGGII